MLIKSEKRMQILRQLGNSASPTKFPLSQFRHSNLSLRCLVIFNLQVQFKYNPPNPGTRSIFNNNI